MNSPWYVIFLIFARLVIDSTWFSQTCTFFLCRHTVLPEGARQRRRDVHIPFLTAWILTDASKLLQPPLIPWPLSKSFCSVLTKLLVVNIQLYNRWVEADSASFAIKHWSSGSTQLKVWCVGNSIGYRCVLSPWLWHSNQLLCICKYEQR